MGGVRRRAGRRVGSSVAGGRARRQTRACSAGNLARTTAAEPGAPRNKNPCRRSRRRSCQSRPCHRGLRMRAAAGAGVRRRRACDAGAARAASRALAVPATAPMHGAPIGSGPVAHEVRQLGRACEAQQASCESVLRLPCGVLQRRVCCLLTAVGGSQALVCPSAGQQRQQRKQREETHVGRRLQGCGVGGPGGASTGAGCRSGADQARKVGIEGLQRAHPMLTSPGGRRVPPVRLVPAKLS